MVNRIHLYEEKLVCVLSYLHVINVTILSKSDHTVYREFSMMWCICSWPRREGSWEALDKVWQLHSAALFRSNHQSHVNREHQILAGRSLSLSLSLVISNSGSFPPHLISSTLMPLQSSSPVKRETCGMHCIHVRGPTRNLCAGPQWLHS